jgi:allantoinase
MCISTSRAAPIGRGSPPDRRRLPPAAARASSCTDFALWGGLTPNNLDKLEELADRGVIGFKAFMSGSGIEDFTAADDLTLYRGMQIAAGRGLVVAVHAENDSITNGLAAEAVRAGRTTATDYLKSRPVVAELEAIKLAIALAEETKCKLHIVHVSSAAGAKLAHAGAPGADVSYETCPHYFLLTEDDLLRSGASVKCAPPLRGRSDADHFSAAFSAGEISFVASDHSPSPPSMKAGDDFFAIWGGIAGVQSTMSAMLSIEPPLQPQAIARYTAGNVASRFGLADKGKIAIGFDADFALIDLGSSFVLKRDDLLDRYKLSPYVGRTFRGVIKRTVVRGQTVFENGRTTGSLHGRLVTPGRDRA